MHSFGCAAAGLRMPARLKRSRRHFLRREGMYETEVNKRVWNAGTVALRQLWGADYVFFVHNYFCEHKNN